MNANEELACKKIQRCTYKGLVIGLGRYLDTSKYHLLNKIKLYKVARDCDGDNMGLIKR